MEFADLHVPTAEETAAEEAAIVARNAPEANRVIDVLPTSDSAKSPKPAKSAKSSLARRFR